MNPIARTKLHEIACGFFAFCVASWCLATPAAGQVLELLPGSDRPIFVTHAGDSRLFVVEREGELRIWDGQFLPTPFLDLSDRIDDTQEGGFLSVAFHPDYAANGRFFVSYTTDTTPNDPQTGFTSIVSRFEVSADPNVADPAETVLLQLPQPFTNHNGGQLQFGPDGMLYIGFGDGGADDPDCSAQSPSSWLGKILRIDVDAGSEAPPHYSIPGDNPYADPDDGVLDEVWAWGLRNPWRFSFDRTRGDLWIGDVGQGDFEEVDREAPNSLGGRNYGWKVMEGTFCRNPDPEMCGAEVPGCADPAYQVPHFEYDHDEGRSITGGYVYRGSQAPGFVGAYLFADFGFGRIWSLHHVGGGAWQQTLLPADGGENSWTSFGEGADGELYVTNTFGNQLFRLDLAELPALSPAPVPLPLDPPSRAPYLAAVASICGDGNLQPGEQCDDGNTIAGDECDEACRHESCGDGSVGTYEQCDDGNTVEDDLCDSECRFVPVPLVGEIKSLKINLRFDKPSKDQLSIKVRDWALPDEFVPTELHVDVGGVAFEGTFDAKGRYKSPDKRDSASLKQSRKTGLWKFNAKRKKGRFSPSLVDEGLTDRNEPKPGVPVTVPVTVEIGGIPYGESVGLQYRAKLGKSGAAK